MMHPDVALVHARAPHKSIPFLKQNPLREFTESSGRSGKNQVLT